VAEQLCERNNLSSAHAAFIEPAQLPLFEEAGWLLADRHAVSLGKSTGYVSFDDFLGALSSEKRKNLRKERARAQDGVEIAAADRRCHPARITGTRSGCSIRIPARANGAGLI